MLALTLKVLIGINLSKHRKSWKRSKLLLQAPLILLNLAYIVQSVSGIIALFTHFSLFFLYFLSLTHTLLSQPVTFILIFHPLPHACVCDIQPTRQVSIFALFLITMCWPHVPCYWLCLLLPSSPTSSAAYWHQPRSSQKKQAYCICSLRLSMK